MLVIEREKCCGGVRAYRHHPVQCYRETVLTLRGTIDCFIENIFNVIVRA
jgi:hypothetical protein